MLLIFLGSFKFPVSGFLIRSGHTGLGGSKLETRNQAPSMAYRPLDAAVLLCAPRNVGPDRQYLSSLDPRPLNHDPPLIQGNEANRFAAVTSVAGNIADGPLSATK
jgi:hypothetical protein